MSSLLFPRPIPSHYEYNSYPTETLFIPKSSQTSSAIPCFYFPVKNSTSRKLLILAHHQSEDIGSCYRFGKYLQQRINVNVLAFEYPGYGCCVGVPCESSMYANILSVIQFVLQALPIRSTDILLYGVSLGGSLCSYAASHFQRQNLPLGGVILQTPFTSLSEISYAFAGSIASSSWIENSFATMMFIKEIECPLLFLHGKRDSITPIDHSQRLYDAAEKTKMKNIALSDTATHSEWDNEKDIIPPVSSFLSSLPLAAPSNSSKPSSSASSAAANGVWASSAGNGASHSNSKEVLPADELKASEKPDSEQPLRFDSSLYLPPPSIIDELDNRQEAERLRAVEERRRRALEEKSSNAALRIRPLKEIDEEDYESALHAGRSGWMARVFCCRRRGMRAAAVGGTAAATQRKNKEKYEKDTDGEEEEKRGGKGEKRKTIEIADKHQQPITPLPVAVVENMPLNQP